MTQEYGFYDEVGDVQDQGVEGRSFPQIQVMNANATLHAKNVIERGGFCIKAENAPNDWGTAETVKHMGGKSSEMRSVTGFEAALIGWSPKYYTVEWVDVVDGMEKRAFMNVPAYVEPQDRPNEKAKCVSKVSLYVALRGDSSRTLYELGVKGFATNSAITAYTKVRNLANSAAAEVALKAGRVLRFLPFALWVSFGVAEPRLVGSVEQSHINDLLMTTPDTERNFVAKEDYLAFAKLRKELDDFLSTGARGVPAISGPALAAAPTMAQIAAPAGASAA